MTIEQAKDILEIDLKMKMIQNHLEIKGWDKVLEQAAQMIVKNMLEAPYED